MRQGCELNKDLRKKRGKNVFNLLKDDSIEIL